MEKEENEDIHTHSKQNNSAIESSLSRSVHFIALPEAFSSKPLNRQNQILHQAMLFEKLGVDGLLLQNTHVIRQFLIGLSRQIC
ncbi:MAG: hypothetical protein AAFQ94_22475 [Bacteroidota bacterium]